MPRPAPPLPPKLAKQAVKLAMELFRRALWSDFPEENAFAVRLPDDDEPWYLSLLGAAGQQFGVACYAGAAGLRALREIAFVGAEDGMSLRCDALVISIDPQRRIPEVLRDVHRAAGHSESLAPSFMSIGADRVPRSARKPELRRVVAILEALLLAHDRGLLRPSPLTASGTSRLLTLTVDGADVRARFEDHAAGQEELRSGVPAPAGLSALPRRDTRWSVGLRRSPARVRDDPSVLFTLLVHDPDRDLPLKVSAVKGEDVELVAAQLLDLMRAGNEYCEPGLPRRVDFANRRLHDAIAPALAEAGVETRFETEQPELAAAYACMDSALFGEPEEEPSAAARAVSSLNTRIREEIARRAMLTNRRRADFYGDAHATPRDEFAEIALITWLTVDFRPSPRHRTLAGRLLASELTDDERQLLQAMVDAAPAIYRVERIDGEGVTLSDLFSRREVVFEHVELGNSIRVGTILAGRVCEAETGRYALWLAPPVPEALATRAFEHLEACGMELSADGVARAPHLLGRLFGWLEDLHERGIALSNTDGDPLRMQSASFACADPDVAHRHLEVRDDVEFDDQDGHWVWFREEGGERRTLLAHIQAIDDRLVVELNSDRRLEQARAWLEDIPGVRFESATELDADAAHPSRAAPSKPVEVTPELAAKLQEVICERYREWIDEEIPALDGLTPRQAVKTADGRRRVELLIRTMPDPAGIPGVVAPRAEIRRELGLDAG